MGYGYNSLRGSIPIKHVQTWRVATVFIGVRDKLRDITVYKMILVTTDTCMPIGACKQIFL